MIKTSIAKFAQPITGIDSPKNFRVGRNDPCPCGSGKKFKACCVQVGDIVKQTKSSDIAGWLQNARLAISRGDFDTAECWFRQVLVIKPKHAEALAGVGQKLCWQRKHREGLTYLRQAAAQVEKESVKSRDIAQLLELSGQLQHWGDLEAALKLAQLAVRLMPQSPVAQNTLAMCLSRINRVDEALLASHKACQLLPNDPGCNTLLAILDARQGQLDAASARLMRITEAPHQPPLIARAYLELATVLDKQQQYDAAFTALNQAAVLHQALPEVSKVNKEAIFDSIAKNKAGFDKALLTRWSLEDLQVDALPVPSFLFGFLRSGTTLTEQILAAHPAVFTSDENELIFELTQELAKLTGVVNDIPQALHACGVNEIRHLRRLYWQRVEEEYGSVAPCKRFIDKVALNSIDAGFISTVFPEANILFALRDPRDVCLSCFMQPFTASRATVNLLSLKGIARQYGAVMDLWLYLRENIQPDYLELRYEDTVSDFETTYRRVFDLLGVDWRPEVLEFHQRAQGRYIATPSFSAVSQPLYTSAVARWHRYEEHLEGIFPELQRFIDVYGYSGS
ncbi:sulfotransferase [Methylobacter sp. S3L5C]|uniref:sulfotransferase family protein n=1 Tax=Methylobacter sp. S3L5C TaxID=2839024 RepID=UPI001FABCCB7|nr:sulfotransferase [Methylobacter sp. S3L5C]UOA10435.1 sulfotransferase [Methylobacter sp. S3L5C]